MKSPFGLERSKEGQRKKKWECPGCGCWSLTRYIDLRGIITFPNYVGYCDHRIHCGYHYTPKQYFREHPEALTEVNTGLRSVNYELPPEPPMSTTSPELMEKSMEIRAYAKNSLFIFLCTIFDPNRVKEAFRLYCVGTSKSWNYSPVFWYVDVDKNIRGGKIMKLNPVDGHRLRDGGYNVTWAHALLHDSFYNMRQCYFGEHLLKTRPDATVILVESEKSAIISTLAFPQYLWLATGGCGNCLKDEQFKVLRDRKVILMPDLGGIEKWIGKGETLKKICPSLSVSRLLLNFASQEDIEKDLDIADFIIRFLLRRDYGKLVLSKEEFLERFKSQSESIRRFFDEMNMEIVN